MELFEVLDHSADNAAPGKDIRGLGARFSSYDFRGTPYVQVVFESGGFFGGHGEIGSFQSDTGKHGISLRVDLYHSLYKRQHGIRGSEDAFAHRAKVTVDNGRLTGVQILQASDDIVRL